VIGERRPRRERGFTYIALLIAVAIMGVWLAASANFLHLRMQRDKEQELLYIGHQFRQAIERYANSGAGNARRLPLRLEDLLLDERFPEKRRHLRRIYLDPMTGQAEWGLVRLADGQIIGVHSLSRDAPVKKAGFDLPDVDFTARSSYSQWVFLAAVKPGSTLKAPTPAASAIGAQAPSR
jgi:type II secretory pathway pseudopilin PulG